MNENIDKSVTKIHNARFYNLTPRAISYLAFNKKNCKLAVLRQDSSIEIWDTQYAVHMEKMIPMAQDEQIEAIGWANNRLFSTGRTGELIEWNLKTLQVEQRKMLTGNLGWCMDVNRAENGIAVGTDEGYVNIFHLSNDDDELSFGRICDKQDGRILCCKYDHSGDILVTGSVDIIRIWNLKSGLVIFKMGTGRMEAKRETIVWSLVVLKDLTIISGDSRGKLTIWDGKTGAQQDSFSVLKADVLAVTVNDDETTLCCSGIDPIIKMYRLTPIKRDSIVTNQWIKFIQRSVHDHDVKALAFCDTKVYSGGIDGYLGISHSTKSIQTLTKYGPFLQQPVAAVAKSSRQLLLKYVNYLELWSLGMASNTLQLSVDEQLSEKYLVLNKGLSKLMEIRSHDEEQITAFAISSDGKLLIYSTKTQIRAFQIIFENDKIKQLKRIKDLPDEFSACSKLLLTDAGKIVLVKWDGSIDWFTWSSSSSDDDDDANDVEYKIEYGKTIETSKYIKDEIKLISISACSTYLICVGTCCNIAIWKWAKTKDSNWKHLINLPKYHLSPTAIAVHDNSPKLVATFSDSKIFEYNMEEMRFTASTNRKFVKNADTHIISNIVLDPNNENVVILHNDAYLFVLLKTQTKNGGKKMKKQNNDRDDTNESNCWSDTEIFDYQLKLTKQYEHFVWLDRLAENELVAVGVNPVTLIEQLPPCLRQKKFGVL